MEQKINENNFDGMHSAVATAGVNEAPLIKPVPTEFLKKSESAGGYVEPQAGDSHINMVWNIFSNNTKNVNNASEVAAGAGADGVAWFGLHMKEIAIVAAAAGILWSLIKLIKGVNKSIKVRYNRVVKSLQKAQFDFVTNPYGLDMRRVFPGQGSAIYDWMARLFTLNLFDKEKIKDPEDPNKLKTVSRKDYVKNSNIGLIPFCERYKDEIAKDFRCSVEAFNKIRAASDQEKENSEQQDNKNSKPQEKENSKPQEKENSETKNDESVNENVYSSFHEAFFGTKLNEENINESAAALIYAGIGLVGLAVRAGQFMISQFNKDGTPVEGTEKKVQVTKESTREICYSIVYNYLSKYVNMDGVFKQLGIDSNSLSDLNKSSCEKLKMFLKKYQKPEKNNYTKQYARIKSAYDKMLEHYYSIGDGIIKNFEKYTDVKDEKHANLLVAGKEKLQGMWDAQKDMFNNNFSHILIEIVASPQYTEYLNFILERVMPTFKSGLAGDADYVLDLAPKKNQYYLIRQTQEQPWLDVNEANKGNVGIAKVLSFDQEKQEIKFRLIGLVNGKWKVTDNGIAELTDDATVDYSAFEGDDGKKKEIAFSYGKWLSMDPFLMDWTEDVESHLYKRSKENITDYIYAYGSKENNDKSEKTEYNRIIFASYDSEKKDFIKSKIIKLKNPVESEEFDKICLSKSDDELKNMDFSAVDELESQGIFYRINSLEKEEVEANSTDDIINIVNGNVEKNTINDMTPLYEKEIEGDIIEQIFGEISRDLNSIYTDDGLERLNDAVNEDDENAGPKIISADDDKASENTIKQIYFIIKKKDNSNTKSYSIELNSPCSLKDLNVKITNDLGFKVADNPNIDYMVGMRNSAGKNKIDKIELDSLQDEIKKIEDSYKQKPAGEDVQKNVSVYLKSVSQGILNWYNNNKSKEINNPKMFGGNTGYKVIALDLYPPKGQGKTQEYALYILKKNHKDSNEVPKLGIMYYKLTKIVEDVNLDNIMKSVEELYKEHKSSSNNQQESIEVTYSCSDNVSEGTSSSVTVNRTYNTYMSKWYVLSESVYDVNGIGKNTNIDSKSFRNKMITRSDVMNYVKNSDSARIMKFESCHTYSISNVYGYVPSDLTPLYESVMFVKFDDNDNIEGKIYVGNNRIA